MKKLILTAALLLLLALGATSCDLESMLIQPAPAGTAAEAETEIDHEVPLPDVLEEVTLPETWPALTWPSESGFEDLTWPSDTSVVTWPAQSERVTESEPATETETETEPWAPMWDKNKNVVRYLAFDQLMIDGSIDVFSPGMGSQWHGVATLDENATFLRFWGWVAVMGEVGTFGYRLGGGEVIWDDAFTVETEEGVLQASRDFGADTGSRMSVIIPVDDIWGSGNTVEVFYRNPEGKVVTLYCFTVDRPDMLLFADASPYHFQIDMENADNYSASIAGWTGFSEPVAALGWSVDGGPITWDGYINVNCEESIKHEATGGPHGFRYTLKADYSTLPYGEHEVIYYARLESGMLCELHRQEVVTKDATIVGNSDIRFDSAVDADLSSVFNYLLGIAWENNRINAPAYKLAGINQLTATMDGTYVITLTNVKSLSPQATLFFRGNPTPHFGDANYYGTDQSTEGIGCAGVYVSIIDENGTPTLRINVKGSYVNENGTDVAVPHVYKVAMTSHDLRVVDDNKALYFYEGNTLLATVELSGFDKGYATRAIVTLNDGTVEVLDDVCAAATAASDIGFIARGSELTFDGVTLTGLPE